MILYKKEGRRYYEASLPEIGSTFVGMLIKAGRVAMGFAVMRLVLDEIESDQYPEIEGDD